MEFEEISKAFVGKPKEYIQVLKALQEDFINSHMMIMDAISENSLDNFRRVNHNLRGSIILLKMSGIDNLMKMIYKYFETNSDIKIKEIREDIHKEFNLIFQALENKINELSN